MATLSADARSENARPRARAVESTAPVLNAYSAAENRLSVNCLRNVRITHEDMRVVGVNVALAVAVNIVIGIGPYYLLTYFNFN